MPQTSFALASNSIDLPVSSPGDDFEGDAVNPSVPLRSKRLLFAVPPAKPTFGNTNLNSGDLNLTQQATLRAVVVASRASTGGLSVQPSPISDASRAMHLLALNELDILCRTRAGYPFIELSLELQEVVISLIASRDLTTPEIDLADWLEDLQSPVSLQS